MSDPARRERVPETEARSPEAAAVRAEILAQATELFHHYGFSKTSMSDIAGRCDMSPANLYRYFRNKKAIGLAAVAAHFRAEEADIEAAMAAAPPEPEARIRAILVASVSHTVAVMDESPRMIELAEFLVEHEEGLALLDAHILWRRGKIRAELERGAAAGVFRVDDAERMAISLQHAVKAFCMPFALARWRDRSTVIPELEGVLDLCFTGIRAGPAAGPG